MGQHDAIREDLRQHVSSIILRTSSRITDDALLVFPHSATHPIDPEYGRRIAGELVQLLAFAIDDGTLSGRAGFVSHAHATTAERGILRPQLFGIVFAIERAALDGLALDETIGAMTEAWAGVALLVRRASFDLLAAIVECGCTAAKAVTDPTTATRTRTFLDAALVIECDRAGRFGDRLALIVFRVDGLAALDARLGRGVADRILRRLGILVSRYFRRQDLVARYADDAIAVLLVRSDAEHAAVLADQVSGTIAHRLESADHRSGETVAVTVSAAVVHAGGAVGAVVDPERLLVDADRALQRAHEHGGNRVEALQSASAIRTPPRSLPSA